MAPTTEFEDNGGTDWTSAPNEQFFLETIANETSAGLSRPGQSLNGLSIWAISIGNPVGGAWLLTGGVHGNEPAGREAALQFIRDVAYNEAGDPDVADYLANRQLVVMPNCNPDGLEANTRHNAADVDLNRTNFTLSQPENLAMNAVRSAFRPHLVVDMHERNASSPDIEYRANVLEAADNAVIDAGWDAVDVIIAALNAAGGITHDIYTGGTARSSFRESSALVHAAGITLETARAPDGPADREFRVANQLVAINGVLDWHLNNDLTEIYDTARARASENRPVPYPLQTGGGAPPWPVQQLPENLTGYEITSGSLSAAIRGAYHISVSGTSITMSQEARPAIPILLDEESDDQLVAATRIVAVAPAPGENLPAGTVSPVIFWLGCDLITGDIIADLPDIRGEISRILGEYTTSKLNLPIPLSGPGSLGELAIQATIPYRTMIVAVVNDEPAWGGLVTRRNGGTGGMLELSCATLEAYLARRKVRDHVFNQVDEAAIYRTLLGDAGTILGVGSGIGLEVDAPNTGVLRNDSYKATDRASVYKRLQARAGRIGGLEWTIELLWGDDNQNWFRKIVRVRPRIGLVAAEPTAVFETTAAGIFESQGGSEARYDYDEDYSEGRGANYVVAYSSGQGEDQPASSPAIDTASLGAGFPIVEHHYQPSSSIRDVSVLDGHATRELELLRNGARTWAIEARWNVYPRLNIDWRLGDDIGWVLVGHRHPQGVIGQGRAIGWDLDGQAGTVKPILLDPQSGG